LTRVVSSTDESAIHLLYVVDDERRLAAVDDALEGSVCSEHVDSRSAAAAAVAEGTVHCVVTTLPDGDAEAFAEAVRATNESLPVVFVPEDGSDERARTAAAAGVTYVPLPPEGEGGALVAERVRELARTERARQAAATERERLERANHQLRALFESAPLPVIEVDPDGEVLRWNHGAEEAFGWSREEAVGRFNPIVPEDEHEAFEQRLSKLLDGQRLNGAEVVAETKSGESLEFLLSAAPVPDTDGTPRSIIVVLNDITAQKRMERRLRELQETAQQLGVAPSIETISEIAVEAAEEVLGLEVTGLWRYDDREHVLAPVSMTDLSTELVDEEPIFTPGNSLAWDAFEEGEVAVYRDLRSVDARYNEETKLRSEIIVPLGDEGVLVTGSTEPRQFSETDVDLFRILGATVEAALVRATREHQRRRQNERLEQFADVLAHDLRNPLTTAQGYLELARESGDPEQFERVETAHDRIGQLIDDLLSLARADGTVEEREPVDISETATAAWELVDTADLSLDVRDPPTVGGDPGRLRQLFENLFRNSLEHGSRSDGDAGATTVTVGALPDDDGFYVEDDGVGIPAADREAVFDHGISFSDGGTGFGLSIVADITRAHGWAVSVAESDAGGARFEFSTADRRGKA
jgi:PAS domain S-box-containing protein